MKTRTLILALGTAALAAGSASAADIVVTGDITTSQTWTKNNVYKLSGQVYVMPGATLTIEPGTVIASIAGGSLAVTRDARIVADGTKDEPIIFTSEADKATWTASNPQGTWRASALEWGNLTIMGNGYIPLDRAIKNILGADNVQVFPDLVFEQYMPALEGAHFAFDGHPFGGYNTAVDLLTLRKPIVTLAGNRFYNLSTAYLLSRVGLDELICKTEQEFIDLGVRMVDNADFRDRMIRRLKTANLEETVLSHEHVPAFVRAIDHLLDNHDRLAKQPGREPIYVE